MESNTSLIVTIVSIFVPLIASLGAFMGFLYKEMKEWRAESKADNAQNRADYLLITAEIKADISQIRADIRSDSAQIRAEIRGETAQMKIDAAERSRQFQLEMIELRKGFQDEIRLQSSRSDKLYETVIALLERQQPKTNP